MRFEKDSGMYINRHILSGLLIGGGVSALLWIFGAPAWVWLAGFALWIVAYVILAYRFDRKRAKRHQTTPK